MILDTSLIPNDPPRIKTFHLLGAMAGTTVEIMKPMNVKEIVTKAQAFEFNPQIPLKYWLRTADTLLREVCSPNESSGTFADAKISTGTNI